MSFRLWYPQLDIYDCIRRMSLLLTSWKSELPSLERFYIIDFYLANPPLLHDTHMTNIIREEFNNIKIPKPDKSFLSYPSSPMLFHKMESVQKESFRTLVGKGLIDNTLLNEGKVCQSDVGKDFFQNQFLDLIHDSELTTLKFLTDYFCNLGINDINILRKNTGLRRVSL